MFASAFFAQFKALRKHSIKKGNDQEIIQSNITPYPLNQKGKKHTQEMIIVMKDTHSKPNIQLFPKPVVIQLT